MPTAPALRQQRGKRVGRSRKAWPMILCLRSLKGIPLRQFRLRADFSCRTLVMRVLHKHEGVHLSLWLLDSVLKVQLRLYWSYMAMEQEVSPSFLWPQPLAELVRFWSSQVSGFPDTAGSFLLVGYSRSSSSSSTAYSGEVAPWSFLFGTESHVATLKLPMYLRLTLNF